MGSSGEDNLPHRIARDSSCVQSELTSPTCTGLRPDSFCNQADRRKDEKLRRLGYRVVRVEAALVMRDTAAVLAAVRAALT
jgi:hypothetical protein